MNPKGIAKARSRLRIAKKAFADLDGCRTPDEFGDTWFTFLVGAKGVYTALEAGAKVSPQSRQWFGAKSHERKQDPTLQYVFQARDDDMHGIEPITMFEPPNFTFSDNIKDSRIVVVEEGILGGKVHLDITHTDDEPYMVQGHPARMRMRPVKGRGNITYPTPTRHKGHPLSDGVLPQGVAKLTILYLEELISDAETLL